MLMTVFFILGFAVIAGAIVMAVLKRKSAKAIIRIIGVGVFSALFFFLYPYCAAENASYAVPLTLFEVMLTAVLGSSPTDVFAALGAAYDVSFFGAYRVIVLILYIIAPMFTIGITLSFFENKLSKVAYGMRSWFASSHIFSDINERTLTLAESIRKSEPQSIILFAVAKERTANKESELARIKGIGGLIIYAAPDEIRHSFRKKRAYYLLDTDCNVNVKTAVRLYEKYDGISNGNAKIWLYGKSDAASVIFDAVDEKLEIRLINEEELIAESLMQSAPLYNAVSNGRLSVLIVGAGNIGMAILRSALMCSMLGDGVKAEFDVIDVNAKAAKGRLEKECPHLAGDYNIRFHTADVRSAEFIETLAALDPTYIAVTLGAEQLDIETAMEIRRFYGVNNGLPKINVLIEHADTAAAILSNLSISDWHFDRDKQTFSKSEIGNFALDPFGSYKETYSAVRFYGSYRDCLAMAATSASSLEPKGDREADVKHFSELLNKVESYKKYSYAYALSIPYKLAIMGLNFVDDGKGDLSALSDSLEKYEDVMIKQETLRWICYMRCDGWKTMPISDMVGTEYSDKLKKLHVRIDDSQTAALSEKLGRDICAEDRRTYYRLPEVIKLANYLYGENMSVRRIKN